MRQYFFAIMIGILCLLGIVIYRLAQKSVALTQITPAQSLSKADRHEHDTEIESPTAEISGSSTADTNGDSNFGTLYGTTSAGGAANAGTVFTINSDGGGYSVLHSFSGGDGKNSNAVLIRGSDGMFYGTSVAGGALDFGTIFKISADGNVFLALHSFNGIDGKSPRGGLIQGIDGALYGTASSDRTGPISSEGKVFKISTDGSVFSILHTFSFIADRHGGMCPYARLIQGRDGMLYGTTLRGGESKNGTVFKISTDGTVCKVIHSFKDEDGQNPETGLVQGRDGSLYGTTPSGGLSDCGTIYKISTDGSVFKVLHSFNGENEKDSHSGLVQDSDGSLYGTTTATVFKIDADGVYSILLTFPADPNGGLWPAPYGELIRGGDGMLYGTTERGGTSSGGTVFRIGTDGSNFSVLHSFGRDDGLSPHTGLIWIKGTHQRGEGHQF